LPFEGVTGSLGSLIAQIRKELQILYRMHLLKSCLKFPKLLKFYKEVKKVLKFIDFMFIKFKLLVHPLLTAARDGLMRYDPSILTDYLHAASIQMI
jgi:hypothetical protein